MEMPKLWLLQNRMLVVVPAILIQACNTVPQQTLLDDIDETPPPSLLGSLSNRREPRRPPRMDSAPAVRPMSSFDNSFAKVDNNVWRSTLPPSLAYQAVTRVVSQNYIIAQADKAQLSITTEWDKFFIDGRLFRNRINASVFPISSRATEIVIRNSVEYYAADSKSTDIKESNWYPTPDVTDEVARLVDSLSRYASNMARTQNSVPR